jgi:FkbM family methyltransferase
MQALRSLLKSGVGRLGYTLVRVPTRVPDPNLELEISFDFVLAHYVTFRRDPRPFVFLEVGANDGVIEDPLHDHVRDKKWHGIFVEPQRKPFEQLVRNHEGLEHLTFINAAISDTPGSRPLYVIVDEAGAPIASLAGLASFRAAPVKHAHRKVASQYPGSRVASTEVTCTTFAEVLAEVSYLDLLQIDAEGYDLELLRLFDFERFAPPIVHFEHRHLSRGDLDAAVTLLGEVGYRMLREEYDVTAYLAP